LVRIRFLLESAYAHRQRVVAPWREGTGLGKDGRLPLALLVVQTFQRGNYYLSSNNLYRS
jgi:hypothetical protein